MAIKKTRTSDNNSRRRIVVTVARQTLRVMDGRKVIVSFPVSTSQFGLGSEEGSLKTPTGRFRIAQKIGDDAAPWTIFRSRRNTGRIASAGGSEDLVLTRILTLDGLEPGNANTLGRYIYIHGTNQEDLIGSPASHGCVRMRNADMIALHELATQGMQVEIIGPRKRKKCRT